MYIYTYITSWLQAEQTMSKKKSQINLLNHSEAKVKLFGDYIQKYLNIICNDKYTKHIHIIDLFCGPGIYENGGEGSPVIALKKLNKHIINS